MSEERENLAGCLEMIDHHVAEHKISLMFDLGRKDTNTLRERFRLVSVKAKTALSQVAKIREVAEAKGYNDVIALLDEKFVCGQK